MSEKKTLRHFVEETLALLAKDGVIYPDPPDLDIPPTPGSVAAVLRILAKQVETGYAVGVSFKWTLGDPLDITTTHEMVKPAEHVTIPLEALP